MHYWGGGGGKGYVGPPLKLLGGGGAWPPLTPPLPTPMIRLWDTFTFTMSNRLYTSGRTYVMTTYVSKENDLGPDAKLRYIWGLKGPIFIL